jgi:hypothetical protein
VPRRRLDREADRFERSMNSRTSSPSATGRLGERHRARTCQILNRVDAYLLMITFRVWFFEIAVSGVNYFVLMNRVYEPRVGKLRAHRIGMTTRIIYIFAFAYLLVYWADVRAVPDLLLAGTYWLLMVLAFEWVGSFLLRRPVREILEGWHIEKGFMWPYVLAAYFFSPLIVGLAVRAVT